MEKINIEAFRALEYAPRMRLGIGAFIPEGSFIAERSGMIVGCVGMINLEKEGWFEIRNLATQNPGQEDLADRLLQCALEYTHSKNARSVKAFTPAVQPYVDAYKRAGFEPVRRSIRVRWDHPEAGQPENREKLETKQLSPEHADEAADVWLAGLSPYWDWWIEEQGGPKEVRDWARGSVTKNPDWWIAAFSGGKMVGIAMLRPDSYGPGEGRFNGAYVLPDYRGHGVGMALMKAVLHKAGQAGQKQMRVYTLAYLDHLAPGAILYLKSGGRIEAEYLQLQAPSG